MNFEIKKMESDEEIKGKAYVHWKSWQDAYKGIVDQNYLDSLTLEKCEEIAFKWPNNLIVAKDGDRVVGFVGYGKYHGEELAETGEIFAIYILEEYYDTGVGKALMQAGIGELDYPQIAVWVLKDNKRAIRFYEKCGFCLDGREEEIKLASPIVEVRMILKNK
ncbi:MAG: GNAT family N-acetyltransferase [Lachnospiraceae bacterium]|nr:GNAT family N-acetyltransferase [Lachnospiraceae bacterium]